MTDFSKPPRGTIKRTRQTYWIDDPLIPVIKKITDVRVGVSQADLVNTALYQLQEVQEELQGDTHGIKTININHQPASDEASRSTS